MSRSYTSLPPSPFMACSGTALAFFLAFTLIEKMTAPYSQVKLRRLFFTNRLDDRDSVHTSMYVNESYTLLYPRRLSLLYPPP
jgi:hypothetical protein